MGKASGSNALLSVNGRASVKLTAVPPGKRAKHSRPGKGGPRSSRLVEMPMDLIFEVGMQYPIINAELMFDSDQPTAPPFRSPPTLACLQNFSIPVFVSSSSSYLVLYTPRRGARASRLPFRFKRSSVCIVVIRTILCGMLSLFPTIYDARRENIRYVAARKL
jgi:hypothetical protein